MMKDICYEPVLREIKTDEYFTVNGSCCLDKNEALRRASKHVSIRDKTAEIVRVDEHVSEV